MNKFWEVIGKFVSWVVINIVSVVVSGYAVSILWSWFVVSLFGLRELSIPQAVGFTLFIRYFLIKYPKHKDDYNVMEEALKSFGRTALSAIVVLGLGWIVLQFV